ncbi:hypothetical protein SGMN_34290 [Stenotrophomonas geniculata]
MPPTSAARNEGATRDRTWAGAGWLAVTRAPAAGGAGPGIGGGDWGGVCNPADNDVNEFVTLSLLHRNEYDMQ